MLLQPGGHCKEAARAPLEPHLPDYFGVCIAEETCLSAGGMVGVSWRGGANVRSLHGAAEALVAARTCAPLSTLLERDVCHWMSVGLETPLTETKVQ